MEDSVPPATPDPDFSNVVLAELYRYPRKQVWIAALLCLLLGMLGAHRFYLGKTFTGILMFLSAGGGLVWWVWDMVRHRSHVADYNTEQARRESEGLAPIGLGFLPPMDTPRPEHPTWFKRRSGRATLISGTALLIVTGIGLGAVSGAISFYEPVATTLVFIVISLISARLDVLEHVPVLRGLNRWVHRLRLYYYHVDPGSMWWLALRPIFGVFVAPLQPKARAEVRLYLQLGIAFSLLYFAFDILEFAADSSFWAGLGNAFGEFVQNLVYTYIFVAPIGAILTTQILIQRKDAVVWIMSLFTVSGITFGLWAVGAL